MVPFSNMRRRTAEHMVRSKATSPHAFIANEVDFESVERVRKAWGERFKAEVFRAVAPADPGSSHPSWQRACRPFDPPR